MQHPIIVSSKGRVGNRDSLFTFPSVRRVQVPTFQLSANPTIQPMTIPRGSIFEMEYKYKVQADEDEEIFKILDSIANSGNKDI